MPTNMDNKANPNATADVMEFTLNKSEVGQVLDMDSYGTLAIPVQVIGESSETYTFRKCKSVAVEKPFRGESVTEMRDRATKNAEKYKDDSED